MDWLFGLLAGVVVLIIGIIIGAALSSPDDDDIDIHFDDTDLDGFDNLEKFEIIRLSNDKKVIKVLQTYNDGVITVDFEDINGAINELMELYIIKPLAVEELSSFANRNTALFAINEEDYNTLKSNEKVIIDVNLD